MVESIDLNRIRYGCFLPDLTGLANGQPVALLCYKYQISVNIQAKFSFILRLRDNNSHLTQLFIDGLALAFRIPETNALILNRQNLSVYQNLSRSIVFAVN